MSKANLTWAELITHDLDYIRPTDTSGKGRSLTAGANEHRRRRLNDSLVAHSIPKLPVQDRQAWSTATRQAIWDWAANNFPAWTGHIQGSGAVVANAGALGNSVASSSGGVFASGNSGPSANAVAASSGNSGIFAGVSASQTNPLYTTVSQGVGAGSSASNSVNPRRTRSFGVSASSAAPSGNIDHDGGDDPYDLTMLDSDEHEQDNDDNDYADNAHRPKNQDSTTRVFKGKNAIGSSAMGNFEYTYGENDSDSDDDYVDSADASKRRRAQKAKSKGKAIAKDVPMANDDDFSSIPEWQTWNAEQKAAYKNLLVADLDYLRPIDPSTPKSLSATSRRRERLNKSLSLIGKPKLPNQYKQTWSKQTRRVIWEWAAEHLPQWTGRILGENEDDNNADNDDSHAPDTNDAEVDSDTSSIASAEDADEYELQIAVKKASDKKAKRLLQDKSIGESSKTASINADNPGTLKRKFTAAEEDIAGEIEFRKASGAKLRRVDGAYKGTKLEPGQEIEELYLSRFSDVWASDEQMKKRLHAKTPTAENPYGWHENKRCRYTIFPNEKEFHQAALDEAVGERRGNFYDPIRLDLEVESENYKPGDFSEQMDLDVPMLD